MQFSLVKKFCNQLYVWINGLEPTDDINAATLLKLFASGKRPSDAKLLAVANEAGIEVQQLWRLRDRLFPQPKKTSNKTT